MACRGVSPGNISQFAVVQKQAFELWRDEVNSRGGIPGLLIEMVIRNDQSDPVVAKRI